jgi:hypothetical protein
MDQHDQNILIAAAICMHHLITAYSIIFDDVRTKSEERTRKEQLRKMTPIKRNLSVTYGRPTSFLEPIPALQQILDDINRPYILNVTHLHSWHFFLLAEHLKDFILRPRGRRDGTYPENRSNKRYKFDHYHRLYFCLKWLNDGNFHRTQETETGWGKSSLQEDTVHVLKAIVDGLDNEIQWPDGRRQQELACVYQGIFKGCVGIADVKEFQVVKYEDANKERRSWSGKKKINSYKMLSVMDHSGRYTYVRMCLGKNDQEVFTGSLLYLQEGNYFSQVEFLASDGGFEGDGCMKCSYKDPGNDEVKKLFNNAWREVRTGVENSYQRTGAWFPLLGNNKRKLPYSEEVLMLAVHASARLHNFIMNSENLSYSASESVEAQYNNYY